MNEYAQKLLEEDVKELLPVSTRATELLALSPPSRVDQTGTPSMMSNSEPVRMMLVNLNPASV